MYRVEFILKSKESMIFDCESTDIKNGFFNMKQVKEIGESKVEEEVGISTSEITCYAINEIKDKKK